MRCARSLYLHTRPSACVCFRLRSRLLSEADVLYAMCAFVVCVVCAGLSSRTRLFAFALSLAVGRRNRRVECIVCAICAACVVRAVCALYARCVRTLVPPHPFVSLCALACCLAKKPPCRLVSSCRASPMSDARMTTEYSRCWTPERRLDIPANRPGPFEWAGAPLGNMCWSLSLRAVYLILIWRGYQIVSALCGERIGLLQMCLARVSDC